MIVERFFVSIRAQNCAYCQIPKWAHKGHTQITLYQRFMRSTILKWAHKGHAKGKPNPLNINDL